MENMAVEAAKGSVAATKQRRRPKDIEFVARRIPGCLEVIPRRRFDARGCFTKVFQTGDFRAVGAEISIAEQYHSKSRRGVLRGMHFQLPPHAHAKLVYCVAGSVLDAVVDLRKGSPTYGKSLCVELSARHANALFIPPGLAHGFFVTSAHAVMVYNVSTVYCPQFDAGIRWDSAGIPWPDMIPTVSDRDQCFPSLREFDSPFRFPMGR